MAIPTTFTVGDTFAHGGLNYVIRGTSVSGTAVFAPVSSGVAGVGSGSIALRDASTVQVLWVVDDAGDTANNGKTFRKVAGVWTEIAGSPEVGSGTIVQRDASTEESIWLVDDVADTTNNGKTFRKIAGAWSEVGGADEIGEGDFDAMIANTDVNVWIVRGETFVLGTDPNPNNRLWIKDATGNWGPSATVSGTSDGGAASAADALTAQQVADILEAQEMNVAERIAGEAISQYKVVAVNDAFNVVNGDSSDDTQIGQILGIAMNAAANGAAIDIQLGGEMEFASWSWTPGSIWFDNTGSLTQTTPVAGFDQVVAVAQSATKIAIQLQAPVDL